MRHQKTLQGRTRRPWGFDNRIPFPPVWAVIRWVVLGNYVNTNARFSNPLSGRVFHCLSSLEGAYSAQLAAREGERESGRSVSLISGRRRYLAGVQ